MKQFEGKTLGYVARRCGFRLKGYRVYVLWDKNDEIGTKVAEDYDLCRLFGEHPELRRSRVAEAQDYYGLLILRVRERAT